MIAPEHIVNEIKLINFVSNSSKFILNLIYALNVLVNSHGIQHANIEKFLCEDQSTLDYPRFELSLEVSPETMWVILKLTHSWNEMVLDCHLKDTNSFSFLFQK